MRKEHLQSIIDQFDENGLKERAVFGILQYGDRSDESYIRANKEGLTLFALEILKSARDAENTLAKKEIIPFDSDADWIDEDSDTVIKYIEPIIDRSGIPPKAEYKLTTWDKLIPFGCGLIFILLIIIVITGLITLYKSFF